MLWKMKIALWKRDGDFRLRQSFRYRDRDVAFDLEPLIVFVRPESDAEIERVAPELCHERLRRRVLGREGMGGGDFGQERDDALRIGPVCDPDVDLDPALAIREGEVRHLLGNQLPVRHDQFRAVEKPDDAGPNPDPANDPDVVLHLHDVAHIDRPLEEQDEPGDEIVHDVLQTETDADPERAGEDGKLRHVHPERGDRDQETGEQNDVVQQRRDGVGRAAIKMKPVVNILFEQKADEARKQDRDPDREREGENRA